MSYTWEPTPERIAAMLRARTRGAASRDAGIAGEQGTFTSTTRPTADQVAELIGIACDDLAMTFAGREPCTDQLATAASTAAAYRTCQLIEASYFPEQTNGEATAFSAFKDLYASAAATVAAAITDRCPLIPNPNIPDGDTSAAALYNGCDFPYVGEQAW